MSELRQNLATKEWVIIAPERRKGKPLQKEPNPLLDTVSAYDEHCPFCPRNHERFPDESIMEIPHPDPDNSAQSPWLARCVENKFKIFDEHEFCPTRPTEFDTDGIYNRFIGCGNHELIVESCDHNKTYATMTREEVEAGVRLRIDRFRELGKNPNNLLTVLFKNHGSRSGASQVHPHSQIVSMRVVPNHLRFLIDEATRYFDSVGVCVFCKMLDYEMSQGDRMVYANSRFAAYVPYAASVPYEVQIFPIKHDAMVADTTEEEINEYADCLHNVMKKLYNALSNPDFNLVLRNPPYHMSNVPFYHWHVRIVPFTSTPGGFELGSRIRVNVVSPEEAAKHLRES